MKFKDLPCTYDGNFGKSLVRDDEDCGTGEKEGDTRNISGAECISLDNSLDANDERKKKKFRITPIFLI